MAVPTMTFDGRTHLPALVAVTVPNMGRMAIHRSEAQQIFAGGGGGSSSSSSALLQNDNHSSTSRTSSTGTISQASASTTLTQPSSYFEEDGDDATGVVSPSYTVMSSFPASQHTTPAKPTFDFHFRSTSNLQNANIKAWSGAASHARVKSASSPNSTSSERELAVAALFKSSAAGLSGEERIRAIRAALPMVKSHMKSGTASPKTYKPSLPGRDMPSLDWPDSPDGPWNSSGKEILRRQECRQQAIARWLSEESSDDEAPSEATALTSDTLQAHRHPLSSTSSDQHPMVLKALHDRKRKEKVLSARFAEIAKQQQQLYGLHWQQPRAMCSTPQSKRPKLGSRQSSAATKGSRNKAAVAQTLAMTPSERRAAQRQARRRQKAAAKTERARMADAERLGIVSSFPPPPLFHEAPYTRAGPGFPLLGCRCGHGDNGAPMLRCDGCSYWYHTACVGIRDPSQIGPDWLCLACCGSDVGIVSPNSVADSTAASLMVTPNFPRSAALEGHALRLSQGELPVFCHPSETPFHRPEGHARHGLSSALALAPSPVMLNGDDMARRNGSLHAAGTSTAQAGRARAARVGWHMHEPSSPLDRKSTGHFAHRRLPSGSALRGSTKGASEASDTLNMGAASMYPESMSAFLRTPSPRLMSTPYRQRMPSAGAGRLQSAFATADHGPQSASTASAAVPSHRREVSAVREFDDVFSTPSRMLHGSAAWDNGPSTSMLRRSREDSMSSVAGNAAHSHNSAQRNMAAPSYGTPWGLSTPTRGLVENSGIFSSSDYSGAADGLPSLVHSSGGVDMNDFASWQHLQGSPTSSTRAGARAALSYNNQSTQGGAHRRTSSMRESTPEALLYSADPSSSPFPKTPTFVSDVYGGSTGSAAFHASRRLSTMSHGFSSSPSMGTPSRKGFAGGAHGRHQRNSSTASNTGLLEALGGPLELHSERRPSSLLAASKAQQQHHQHGTIGPQRGRKVSTDVMAGLGIGLDLNDVLDWS